MSERTTSRLVVALLMASGPLLSIGACGGSSDDSSSDVQGDAATSDVATETSMPDDAALDASGSDASKRDATVDAGVLDAAKTLNRCGGYSELELGGNPVTPGASCGACDDGTIACVGSNVVECAGASSPPCPAPAVDAGPNACGGYGPLTFFSVDASIGDPCGECGEIQCASTTTSVCAASGACSTDAGLQSTCTIPSAAYTATPPTPTLSAETRPSVTSSSAIALSASDLVYNPYDGFLYATVSDYLDEPNGIAKIDPVSVTVLQTLYVGISPGRLALSDDGKVLWVVMNELSPAIRRVDLTTFTAESSFALPPGSGVVDINVLAGTEDSVAVLSSAPYPATSSSLVIYDHGIPRPYGVAQNANALVSTASASLLFIRPDTYPADYTVSTICADSNGAFVKGSVGQLSYAGALFSADVLYETDGTAYDAQSGTLLHTFSVTPAQYMLITTDVNDVYFLTSTDEESSDSYWVQVTGFDRTTYTSTITDLLQTSGGSIQSFTRWGRYGFAYINIYDSIVIARSTIIPDMP
jgi:hypothetical protein